MSFSFSFVISSNATNFGLLCGLGFGFFFFFSSWLLWFCTLSRPSLPCGYEHVKIIYSSCKELGLSCRPASAWP